MNQDLQNLISDFALFFLVIGIISGFMIGVTFEKDYGEKLRKWGKKKSKEK